jgi:hypothetical protein
MMADVLITKDRAQRWHSKLVRALRDAGLDCAVRPAEPDDDRPPLPQGLALLLWLDQTLHGAGEHALDRIRLDFDAGPSRACDVTIDLTGGVGSVRTARHLVPLFDVAVGEAALWSALLDGRAPRLDLFDAANNQVTPIGLPATEAPHQLMFAADQVIARLIQGIVRVVRHELDGTRALESPPSMPSLAPRQPISALANILTLKTKRVLARRLRREPQWSVAWRPRAANHPLPDIGSLDLSGWTVLPDDGQRYYADPFIFAHSGRRFIFVEEYPYATGRGLVSVAEIGADGRAHTVPQPVLAAPFHLSYPQVFAHSGQVYMLPEAAASGRLTLYRAERFPDRWVAVCDLLSEPVHDATLLETPDGCWLFATTDAEGGSSWDALNLYHAPGLMGPWRAHDMNPVLIDAGSARPTGAMFRAGGDLWRPVQDCRAGYGAGLGFARIDQLDQRGFGQTVVRTVLPPARSGFCGVHTWSGAANLEAVDVFGPRPGGG